jgi:hypothetical protein
MANPLIYEINGRIWINNLNQKYGKRLDLDSLPDSELISFKEIHADYVWLMGLWQTGKLSVKVSQTHGAMQTVYQSTLPDFKMNDVSGSPYAIAGYQPAKIFGSIEALRNFRRRLNATGIKLILDFIPNHTGLDHPWLHSHPEYYMRCSDAAGYYQEHYKKTRVKIAHGKDPYFPAWTDTLQLDYTNRQLRKQQINILLQLAQVCDGVRCDMAMLVTQKIIQQTWNRMLDEEFWIGAIGTVKEKYPEFIFIAEVYWDMEWQLQQMGFDYTYDKRLYDRLSFAPVYEITNHLKADQGFQNKLIRFIENHDEPRAISHFGIQKSLAAATVIYTLPGMRFLHQGQTEGLRIKIPVQLNRMPPESENQKTRRYYKRLLEISSQKVFKSGNWRLELCHDQKLLSWTWRLNKTIRLVIINYSDQTAETNIALPVDYPLNSDIIFTDELTGNSTLHRKQHLQEIGLYVKLAPYQAHIFSVKRQT